VSEPGAPPIIQYWHSDEVPAEVVKLTSTFADRNPDLRYVLFSEQSAETFIAERFGGRELAAFRSCAVPAMQADYFRICAVLALGGIYADVDLLCARPLRSLVEPGRGGLLFENSQGHILNEFFVFRVTNHPLLRLTLDVTTENIERRVATKVHEVTGPWVQSLLVALLRRGSFEAARREAAGKTLIEPLVDSMIAAVDDYARIPNAFEDVRIEPIEAAWSWIAKPDQRPLYKDQDLHWENWHRLGRGIFR
jgi:mannosyltransferase OCH1-like enzyme